MTAAIPAYLMNAKDTLEIGIARYRRMLDLELAAREGNARRQEEIERDGEQGNGSGVMRHERLRGWRAVLAQPPFLRGFPTGVLLRRKGRETDVLLFPARI